MTLIDRFEEELQNGKTSLEAFYCINDYTLDYTKNHQFTITIEVLKFGDYIKKEYPELLMKIKESDDEPFILFLYDFIKSIYQDEEMLLILDTKIDKKKLFEIQKLLKEFKNIFDKYGSFNLSKSGFIQVNNELKTIKNDIYIQDSAQLETNATINFLTVALSLDYSIINIITYDEKTSETIMFGYHVSNGSWYPISTEEIQFALQNIDTISTDDLKLKVCTSEKKY